MKHPTLLKANVSSAEEAREVMEFLYCDHIDHTGSYTVGDTEEYVTWFETKSNDSCIAKWTKEYGNLMISRDFIERMKQK